MICKRQYRVLFAIIMTMALLLSLSACKGKHKHTYAEQFSRDAENHWRPATCEHTEEKKDFGAHEIQDGVCKTCGYQQIRLQVKTESASAKYLRTTPVHEMLMLGFAYGDNTTDVQWVKAKQNNIASYTIADGKITVTVCAMANNIQYTGEISIPAEETPVSVDSFFAQSAEGTYMLNGIVAGFASIGTHNEVVLADKQTGKLVNVRQMGEGKLLYGGYSLPGIEIGDEIIVPVSLVKEDVADNTANSAKVYALYKGGTDYKAAVVSKKNQIQYPTESVLIDSQADLEEFMSAGNRENNHYKVVKFKGKMNFVMDTTYENYNFWFSEKQAVGKGSIQIDNITPCFNDPAISYTNGMSFSKLVFGEAYQAPIDYKNPVSADVEFTAVYLGGSTTFGQFLILDQSWVTK